MTRQALPARRPNITTEALWKNHLVTVSVGLDLQGQPREVFANTLSGGDMQAALADACVVISIALQHDIPAPELAKSLGRAPDFTGGEMIDAPASPIGVIINCIIEAGQ